MIVYKNGKSTILGRKKIGKSKNEKTHINQNIQKLKNQTVAAKIMLIFLARFCELSVVKSQKIIKLKIHSKSLFEISFHIIIFLFNDN